MEKKSELLKVKYREFYCEARLIDGVHKMRVKVTPNLGDESLVYDLKDFEKYFTYADGRKIEANSLKECMTMHCKRIPGQIIMARYENESWFIDTIGTDYRLANKSFAVCFEPYRKDGDTEEEKEAKRLPVTENIKIAVYFITKSGEMIETVNIRIQGGKIVYGVKGKDLIRKPVEEGYKTVGTLTRGIKKAIEELVWDGSNHVVGFKIRDYEAVRDYKLEV